MKFVDNNKKENKIYIIAHKKSHIPKCDSLFEKINIFEKENVLYKGYNLQELNPYFCELCAQFWAKENIDSEFYGFFHYRRFFSFHKKIGKYNVLVEKQINDSVLAKYNINRESLNSIYKNYDLVIPLVENMEKSFGKSSKNIYLHYKNSKGHDITDFDNAIKILKRKYPNFKKYINKAIKSKKCYFFNMFIMKKQYFLEYIDWLWSILIELHANKNYDNLNDYEKRMPGFIAERLFTIYIFYLKDKYKNNLKIKECQTLLFEDTTSPYLKPVNNDNTCVVYSVNDKNIIDVSLSIRFLSRNVKNKYKYDVILFDNQLSFFNKNTMIEEFKNDKHLNLRFVRNDDISKNQKNCFNFKKEILMIFNYLTKYERVILFNSNLLPLKQFDKIIHLNLKNKLVAYANESNNKATEYHILESYDGILVLNIKAFLINKYDFSFFNKICKKKEFDYKSYFFNQLLTDKVILLDNKWNYKIYENHISENFKSTNIINYKFNLDRIFEISFDFRNEVIDVLRKSSFYESLLVRINNLKFKQKINKKNLLKKFLSPLNFLGKCLRLIKKVILKIYRIFFVNKP